MRALALLALCAGLGGCGKDQGPSTNSDDIAREHRREQRLAELERRVAELRRARREQAPGSSKSLPGFDALARGLGGQVGVAVGPPGSAAPATAGTLITGAAWSTIKVPIALRLLQDVGGPERLDGTQRGQIERAITASDNGAAEQLFDDLKSRHGGLSGAAAAVTEVLRKAGDDTTKVSTQGRDGFSPYGQTQWSLEAQERFMAALAGGCVGDGASRRYLLDLMGHVTSDRWGLGSAGVSARWKGGWGPELDGRYLARQMGVLDLNGKQLVVTIAAKSSDGQFESGQAMASRLAAWLAKRATLFDRSPAGC